MSTITPYYRTVQQLLQGQSLAIDEYQREYKWERENIEELLSDLRDKFLSCHHPGDTTKAVSIFKPYAKFGKNEQVERRVLLKTLVNLVWSPERLLEYLPDSSPSKRTVNDPKSSCPIFFNDLCYRKNRALM